MGKCIKWYESKIKKMTWCDMKFVKLSVFAAALLVAKLWPPILSLDWYWYAVVLALAMIKPLMLMLKK